MDAAFYTRAAKILGHRDQAPPHSQVVAGPRPPGRQPTSPPHPPRLLQLRTLMMRLGSAPLPPNAMTPPAACYPRHPLLVQRATQPVRDTQDGPRHQQQSPTTALELAMKIHGNGFPMPPDNRERWDRRGTARRGQVAPQAHWAAKAGRCR